MNVVKFSATVTTAGAASKAQTRTLTWLKALAKLVMRIHINISCNLCLR